MHQDSPWQAERLPERCPGYEGSWQAATPDTHAALRLLGQGRYSQLQRPNSTDPREPGFAAWVISTHLLGARAAKNYSLAAAGKPEHRTSTSSSGRWASKRCVGAHVVLPLANRTGDESMSV